MSDKITQKDQRMYLINYKETDRNSFYYGRVLVSHGVGDVTLKAYCLPPEPIEHFDGKKYDVETNEWYMEMS